MQAWLTPVPPSIQVPVRNRILTKLAPTEHQRLRSSLMQVELHENQVLFAPGDPVSHVYFPNDGVVSLPVDVDERRAVEVAMEGNEGAVGLATYLDGVQSCNLAVVRNARTAMRMEVNALEERAVGPGGLPQLLRRYIHALVTHIAQSGVCNRFHSLDARLARWLLMTLDRMIRRTARHTGIHRAHARRSAQQRNCRCERISQAAHHRLPPRPNRDSGPTSVAGRLLGLLLPDERAIRPLPELTTAAAGH